MTQQLVERPAHPAPSTRWNRPIQVAAAITGGLFLFFGAISVVGFFMIETSTQTSNFVNPVTRVQVDADTGDVVIRTGTAQRGASVVSRSSSSFRTAEHRERVSDGVLQVSGSCRGGMSLADNCSVDFEIVVPPGTVVQASTTTGNLSVTGTGAAVTAHSRTGDLRVSLAAGSIRLTTNVGDIVGESLGGGDVSGRSNTGDVRLNFTAAPDQLRASTNVGDIRVLVPDDSTAYRVTSEVNTGDRHIDVPTDPGAGRAVHLSTNTGDVRLGLAR